MTSPTPPRPAGSARTSGGPSLGDYLPPVDELTAPWWDATRERRLLLQTCGGCGARQHHPRYLCTACGVVDDLGWTGSTGSGVVDTFTVVHRAPRESVVVPYLIARVRLDDGPILLSRLVDLAAVDAATIGDRVRLGWYELSDGRALPVFALEEK